MERKGNADTQSGATEAAKEVGRVREWKEGMHAMLTSERKHHKEHSFPFDTILLYYYYYVLYGWMRCGTLGLTAHTRAPTNDSHI